VEDRKEDGEVEVGKRPPSVDTHLEPPFLCEGYRMQWRATSAMPYHPHPHRLLLLLPLLLLEPLLLLSHHRVNTHRATTHGTTSHGASHRATSHGGPAHRPSTHGAAHHGTAHGRAAAMILLLLILMVLLMLLLLRRVHLQQHRAGVWARAAGWVGGSGGSGDLLRGLLLLHWWGRRGGGRRGVHSWGPGRRGTATAVRVGWHRPWGRRRQHGCVRVRVAAGGG